MHADGTRWYPAGHDSAADGALDEIDRLRRERDEARAALDRLIRSDQAEVGRLRSVAVDALWLARLAEGSSWPGEMAHRVEQAAARVRAVLGEATDE